MDLSVFIETFIKGRNITLQALSASLGFKSDLTLERIITGKTGKDSAHKFGIRLSKAYSLTDEEKRLLLEAEQTTESVRPEDQVDMEMWAFLQGNNSGADMDCELEIEDAATGEKKCLLETYKNARNLKMTLLNCQYSPVFLQLQRLLQREDVTVEHYLALNRDIGRTSRSINALLPVFSETRYFGYSILNDTWDYPRGLIGADALGCAYENADGEAREDLFMFDEPCHAYKYSCAAGGALLKLLGIPKERFHSFKRTYFSYTQPENYVQYSEEYAQLEYNRAVYKIKPDIGIDYIYGSILAAAAREGPMPKSDGFDEMLEAIEKVYADRVRNTFSKRKNAYTILKKRAMRKFVETGRTSDHFWGMRPFTPAERARILTVLLNQQNKNPYFHLFFLKDDDEIRDVEIALYDDLGILILNADTHYNLAEGHAEALVTHKEFMRLYKDFFLRSLIKRYVLSDEETNQYLNELLEECQKREQNGENE